MKAMQGRTLSFSGYLWRVKASQTPVGPGPNYFSDSDCNVWLDAQGRLHLKITRTGGVWQCAEVICTRSLGYGTYRFYLASEVHALDPRVVLGLFTWSDNPEFGYREIDIEFARFQGASGPNAFYTIRPHNPNPPQHAFYWVPNTPRSVHLFRWEPTKLYFRSVRGHRPEPSSASAIVAEWTYTGSRVPPAGDETPRINLWLTDGQPPTNGREVEVIIARFEFLPLR
jgi:hypothetical protein